MFNPALAQSLSVMRCLSETASVSLLMPGQPLPPLPPPSCAPCVDCSAELTQANQSGVKGYCWDCYFRHVQKNQERVQGMDLAGKDTAATPKLPEPAGPAHLESLAALAEAHERPVSLASLSPELRAGRPSRVSWCTWFQRIMRETGRMSGSEALKTWQTWCREDPQKCDDWKQEYAAECAAATKQCDQADDASVVLRTPERSRPPPCEDPASSEKTVPPDRGRQVVGESPRYTTRVSSLPAFRKRWRWLQSKLQKGAGTSQVYLLNSQDTYLMYLDVVSLLAAGVCNGEAAALARELDGFHINRNKIASVRQHLEDCKAKSKDYHCAPPRFCAGRHGTGVLTLPQKRDVLRWVQLMSRSNRALQPREIQEAMLRMYLCNTGFVDASDGREVAWESFNVEAHASGMARVYRDWREWVAAEYPDTIKLLNKKAGIFFSYA